MTEFERGRIDQYLADAQLWLTTVHKALTYPATPRQAAAADFVRVALEAVSGAQRQMELDKVKGEVK